MIRRTHWQTVAGLVIGSAGVTYVLAEWWAAGGRTPVPVSGAVAVVILAFAAVLFWLGRSVRRFVLGKRPGLNPLRAFRILVLAKASVIAGSLQLGFFAAHAAALVTTYADAPEARRQVVASAVNALACGVLVGVGLLVEWFCRVPPPEDEPQQGTPT
jgi:hypothetical protein